MENIIRTCAVSGKKFVIDQQDQEFYKRVAPVINGVAYDLPLPILCPEERRRRRFTHRNERHLYHRKCDLSGKSVISNYSPDGGMVVYDNDEWWSDKWDPKSYGMEFDFQRPFFEQFQELSRKVPQLALSVWNSENSNYCNYVGHVKNSYLIFGSVYSENCYYGSPYYSVDCVDTLVVRECEYCYECVDCRKLYECMYCQDCQGSRNLIYCYDLQNCSDCIGCAGMRNKKFCIFNVQYSEGEYKKYREKLNLCDGKAREKITEELARLKLMIPHRFMQSKQVEYVSGNYVYNSKNALDCYYTDRCEDVRYCAQVVDLKDCYDNNFTEENELCCEYLGSYQNNRILFSKFCNKVSESMYCDSCFTSKNLFGCIGLRGSQYCILNKQYSRKEYEELVPKIIEHMKRAPMRGEGEPRPPPRRGRQVGVEWGEFFPASLSPFGYNETVANEYFPLTREEVEGRAWRWKEEEDKGFYDGPAAEVSADISDVSDEILKQILTCDITGKSYKIIPHELRFYKKMHLPIPRKSPNERHSSRLALRNPQTVWNRKCDKCQLEIQTTYAPERPEQVYCEKCYLAAVY